MRRFEVKYTLECTDNVTLEELRSLFSHHGEDALSDLVWSGVTLGGFVDGYLKGDGSITFKSVTAEPSPEVTDTTERPTVLPPAPIDPLTYPM